jgi:hypothetical protein
MQAEQVGLRVGGTSTAAAVERCQLQLQSFMLPGGVHNGSNSSTLLRLRAWFPVSCRCSSTRTLAAAAA